MLGYDNILFLGYSNPELSEFSLNGFCNICNLSNLVRELAWFKNPNNPTCIIEEYISDFHKMEVTILKVFYMKQKPENIQYRSYKNFSSNVFWQELSEEILYFYILFIENL